MHTRFTDIPTLEAEPEVRPRPHPVGALEALRYHPFLFLLAVVVMVTAAITFALTRSPVYSAQTRLGITSVDASVPGALANFAVASKALTEAYSRAAEAQPVISRVAKKTGMSQDAVRRRIRAAPIPNTPVFRIKAHARTKREAVALANAEASSLSSYLANLIGSSQQPLALLSRYRKAAQQVQRLRTKSDRLASDPNVSDSALADARAAVETAKVRVTAFQQAYLQSQLSQGTSGTITPQVLDHASSASSDRGSKLQLLGFIGLVSGIGVGLGLVLLLANLRLRRLAR